MISGRHPKPRALLLHVDMHLKIPLLISFSFVLLLFVFPSLPYPLALLSLLLIFVSLPHSLSSFYLPPNGSRTGNAWEQVLKAPVFLGSNIEHHACLVKLSLREKGVHFRTASHVKLCHVCVSLGEIVFLLSLFLSQFLCPMIVDDDFYVCALVFLDGSLGCINWVVLISLFQLLVAWMGGQGCYRKHFAWFADVFSLFVFLVGSVVADVLYLCFSVVRLSYYLVTCVSCLE